jgi:hypothetical protein
MHESLRFMGHVHPEDFGGGPDNDTWQYPLPLNLTYGGKYGFFFDWALDENEGCAVSLEKHMATHMSNIVGPAPAAEHQVLTFANLPEVPPLDPAEEARNRPAECVDLAGAVGAATTCPFSLVEGLVIPRLVPLERKVGQGPLFVNATLAVVDGELRAGKCSLLKLTVVGRRDLSPYLEAAAHVAIVSWATSPPHFSHAHGFAAESTHGHGMHMNLTCAGALHMGMAAPPDTFGPDVYFHATFSRAGPHLVSGQTAVNGTHVLFWHFTVNAAAVVPVVQPTGAPTGAPAATPPATTLGPSPQTEPEGRHSRRPLLYGFAGVVTVAAVFALGALATWGWASRSGGTASQRRAGREGYGNLATAAQDEPDLVTVHTAAVAAALAPGEPQEDSGNEGAEHNGGSSGKGIGASSAGPKLRQGEVDRDVFLQIMALDDDDGQP